jgi:hypothetical protein
MQILTDFDDATVHSIQAAANSNHQAAKPICSSDACVGLGYKGPNFTLLIIIIVIAECSVNVPNQNMFQNNNTYNNITNQNLFQNKRNKRPRE